jgi:membrane protein YdbS with pleckstrin-like domain
LEKKKNEEKIIKPPVKQITSGKIFKTSRAFLYKQLFQAATVYALIWLFAILCFLGFSPLIASEEPIRYASAAQVIDTFFVPVVLWTLGINLIWFVPALVAIPPYVRSIEYSVKSESGDTMPEIYSKRGIITITRKHVPFRTITNISSRAGPFDRLFKIGSVHIETAGYSGASQKGPEEKISGIVFYEEVRDFILKELRKFKEPYVIGTEVVHPTEEPVPRMDGLEDEILITLREIRDILKNRSGDNRT